LLPLLREQYKLTLLYHPSMKLTFLLVCVIIFHVAVSQQGNSPKLQPLGDVLMQVLDTDKNQKVTIEEVQSQMTMFEQLFQDVQDGGEDASGYRNLVKGVKKAAPSIMQLLDTNKDQALSLSEMQYITKFEKSILKGGGFKDCLRTCFTLIDSDGDDRLSMEELQRVTTDEELISSLVKPFQELFPGLRCNELFHSILHGIMVNDEASSFVDGMNNWIDKDGDGFIQRKEVGLAYNTFGKKFLEISKTIKTMGPMMAMLGGDMGGMNMNHMGAEL